MQHLQWRTALCHMQLLCADVHTKMSSQRHHGWSSSEKKQNHEQQVMLLVPAKGLYDNLTTIALQLTEQRLSSLHASTYILMMLQDLSMKLCSAWLTYLQLSSLCQRAVQNCQHCLHPAVCCILE